MALFARRPRNAREGIAAFWAWWNEAHVKVDEALEADDLRRLHRTLTDRVQAIHPDLAWELTKGRAARRALVLSPEGSPALRPLTERWLRAAPAPDPTWEYHAARPPDPDAYTREVQLGDRTFRPALARFGVETDTERARVHVAVWHPDFVGMDEAVRLHASFLLLDWAVGEDDVERWLGEVRISPAEQPDDVAELRGAVVGLAALFDRAEWVTIDGVDERGQAVLARLRVPFPRLDHPLLDLHGAVTIKVRANGDGLPDESEAAALDELADGLMGRLGSSAALVAVVTAGGERTLHLYADADGVVEFQVAGWVEQQLRTIDTRWTPDPGWEAVRALY